MSSGSLSRDMKIDTDPESLLRCLLSGERAIIDGPVQDTDPDSAMNEDTDEPEEIGRGKCGRVLRYDNCVLKSSHLDQHENLYNDFEMHTRVLKAFWKVKNTHHIDIHVPNIDHLSTTTDERHGHRLTLLTDYIHPMPYEVNEAMVKTIFPSLKDGIDKFLARSDNQHCLPRIHLGRRGFPHKDRVDDESLTLRDISLQLDELEQLRVNAYDLADTMGKALAVLHWKAGVNGAGVKFVLGQVPAAQAGAASVSMDRLSKGSPQNDTVERRIGLWLIDFDRCERFKHNEKGLKSLLDAYAGAYFPTPHTRNYFDTGVWTFFRDAYLEMSGDLSDSYMSEEFIHRIQTQKMVGEVGDAMGELEGLTI